MRLYDASVNSLKGQFVHGGPVLDCCFHDDALGLSGSKAWISAQEPALILSWKPAVFT